MVAFEAAFAEGVGAVKLGDKMIDKPVYLRALNLLKENGRKYRKLATADADAGAGLSCAP